MEGSQPPTGSHHEVLIRNQSEAGAMGSLQRNRMRMRHMFKQADDSRGDEHSELQPNAQYCLKATRRTRPNRLRRLLTFNGRFANSRMASMAAGVNPNQKLAMSLHWMFRVNFLFLFAVMCITFFALVILFSGFITLAGRMDAECVRVGGAEFDSSGAAFADAFALSWTTFSTVGYGSTYPALGHQNKSPTNCFLINFICSLESLLGVLYSGFCGAILFGKVLRIQSHAQVVFSDPILLRFGSGVLRDGGSDMHTMSGSDEESPKSPYPILEFRVVNRLYNEPGGEIMDATLNVVANCNADDTDPTLMDSSERHSGGRLVSGGSMETVSDDGSASRQISYDSGNSFPVRFFSTFREFRDHNAFDDGDPSSRVVQHKHIFSKLAIEAPEHPFFKRCWVATHVLDHHSPILKPRIRKQIRRYGGWPEKFNNYQTIRDSLQFNQILVSLNGVSNISASDVYAQKIYDFVDVNIGYQFVNILYRDSADSTLGVDIDLINDVREQDGGGGEPLMEEDDL